jgi:hypothetical protein
LTWAALESGTTLTAAGTALAEAAGPTRSEPAGAAEAALSAGTALSTGTEAAAGTALAVVVVPHLASAIVVVTAAVVMMPVMTTAGAGAECEAAEEDDGDDEHGAGDDADPRGNDVQLAAAAQTLVVARLDDGRCLGGGVDGCRGGGVDGTCGWFWRRWCFAHVSDLGDGNDAPIMKRL